MDNGCCCKLSGSTTRAIRVTLKVSLVLVIRGRVGLSSGKIAILIGSLDLVSLVRSCDLLNLVKN